MSRLMNINLRERNEVKECLPSQPQQKESNENLAFLQILSRSSAKSSSKRRFSRLTPDTVVRHRNCFPLSSVFTSREVLALNQSSTMHFCFSKSNFQSLKIAEKCRLAMRMNKVKKIISISFESA